MNKVETLEELYKQKFNRLPDRMGNGIGHFNLFRLEPLVEGQPTSIPYKRRDYYKIMFVVGKSKVHYADKVVEVHKQALSFSNPQIPYKWEHLDNIRQGFYCIFNQQFFHQFGDLAQYTIFQPEGTHIFELTDEQVSRVHAIYERMFEEIHSDYTYKYDLLRNLVFELIHFAMKIQPAARSEKQQLNASQRIVSLFLELLERQFPIDQAHQQVKLRAASDFANQLNIHVNHLNRAIKMITQKTTSHLIAERILQEAKILLKHSNWQISEIAYALRFPEVTHFDNFFKQHVGVNPSRFRNS
ncbi:helix-turn-helix transcriptional regulator [Cytophagaceae bacterium DM2B3-1]|uniref:Helix-turn-helix transcriptional regulator n=1 Tax=Xanthocytophaga flava TaxID=3048013 RepID=A0ABT7CR51_9BACT|nr:helix-turn-helix transcriptional regulator [Xanthocytophaga flavus]MDJ1466888.1 helix-turn-helix transcriptional regulator [Xanthocytophaga flavus]MDJ1496230.1 helix-turn-helix transcriptional regulator [Xanthocytophaga flavus]